MVIAEDDDTYQPESPPEQLPEGSCPRWRSKQQPEKVLFCGWRRGEPSTSCICRLVLFSFVSHRLGLLCSIGAQRGSFDV